MGFDGGFNPFPTLTARVQLARDRDRKHSYQRPCRPPEMAPAPPGLGYGYIRRIYVLWDRSLDAIPDHYSRARPLSALRIDRLQP